MTEHEYTVVFLGVEKEPEDLRPDIEAGKLYIVLYPFPEMGTGVIFTYDPDNAIKTILEDKGIIDPITIISRKATLADLSQFTELH